jgi:NTE family protein
LAHIGVLRWLEEHRIPVNYVAGTSMGGLVGGIYATGHTATEVSALVKTINWDEVLQGQIPYRDLAFRRKQDAYEYPNRLEFGLKKGVQFPEGFNSGLQVGMILDRVSLPYSAVENFNDLPIPFACVATDLVTSQKFVFRQGSLSLALRSTMSLPGIFSPVRSDGHIFADGGLMDNLPVDVARSMGADLTLAVHLQTAKLDSTATLSSFGVLSRSISVVVAANELRSIEEADMLISVPLQGFGSLDYDRADEIIKLGYEAAQSKAALLETLSVDEATWQAYLEQRAARRRAAPVPEFVEVAVADPKVAKAVEKELQNNVGKPVETAALQNQLLDLSGEGRFTSLRYQTTNHDGKTGLLIVGDAKPYTPPIVLPLLLLDGANFEGVNFSLGARILFQDFGSYRAELRNDVIIGSQYGIATQYYRPLSATSKWFVAPSVFANYQQYPIYHENDFLAQYRKSALGGGTDFGYEFDRTAQLTLGYTAAYQKFIPKIGNVDLLPRVSGRYGATKLRLAINEVDNPVIPRTGQIADISSSWVDSNPGAAHAYPLSEGRIVKLFKVSQPASIYFGAGGGTTFGNKLVGVPSFGLGGPNSFAAYGENELLTNQYYVLKAGYLRKVARLPVLLGEGVYFNGVVEGGKVFGSPFQPHVPGDVSAALVINTIFGPLSMGGAVGTEGHQRIFFKLGRIF